MSSQRSASVRAVSACYALMAAVTVIATGIGFWLSYAGLHSFAARAGLRGPEAWAWPSSVDLFILAGELGITISTLRDGKTDWRAWVYFAAGCGPSVTFNVLHVALHAPAWGRYAVAATPPLAAVLALAALMQQVISLPDALRHMHQDSSPAAALPESAAVVPEVATSVHEAAKAAYAASVRGGHPLSERGLADRFGLPRSQARKLRAEVTAASNGQMPENN